MKRTINRFKNYTVHNIQFYNLNDMYEYLKSNPSINYRIFKNPSSINNAEKYRYFYGRAYAEALECLNGSYQDGYADFSKMLKNIGSVYKELESDEVTISRGIHGGIAHPALVAMGVVDPMLSLQKSKETASKNIYFNLAYRNEITEHQIRNRGLATLYIIKALEQNGYLVNLKAFELLKANSEMFCLGVDLKNSRDYYLNIRNCYFAMVAKEFARRIAFRLLETSSVKDPEWGKIYGYFCYKKEVQEFFKATSSDLIISEPSEVGIKGKNIYEDILNLIASLELTDEFSAKHLKLLQDKAHKTSI